MHEFYYDIHVNFPIKFNDLVNNLPADTAARQQILSDNLSHLNAVLAKLDPRVAHHLYVSYTSFAKSVAESSGGILRFGTISQAEKKWIGLPMITPIAEPIQEEETEEL